MELPCIDLHGRTKNDAISALASFLNSHRSSTAILNAMLDASRNKPCPVLVITGSGKHSKDGPVLRSAIEKYLEKRQMHFVLNRGKGAFTVDCASGIDLYFDHHQKVCSKVVVIEREQIKMEESRNNSTWKSSVTIHMKKPDESLVNSIPIPKRSSKADLNNHVKLLSIKDTTIAVKDIISHDTSTEEADIRAIVEKSKLEQNEKLQIQKMTDEEIYDCIRKSQRFILSSVDKSQIDHETQFLSLLQHEKQRRDEEEQYLAIIELSRQLEELNKKEREREEIAIQRLLERSQQEVAESSTQSDDEDAIAEAIQMSLKEAASSKYSNEEEEQLIQQTLALSMCDM